MKKILCVLFSAIILIGIMPLQGFAAEKETVEIYGNKISVHAKQVCFVKGGRNDNFSPESYDGSFKKYYYVGDSTVDFKLISKKLPELQNLAVIGSNVKNTSALKSFNDLVWLGLHECGGTENLSFLKNLGQLKKFRYTFFSADGSPERLIPLSFLKNVTELYVKTDYESMQDLSPIKNLQKLTKLHLYNVTAEGTDALAGLTNLRLLDIRANDREKTVDLSFLEKLSKLEELYVTEAYDTKSRNISCVQRLPKLKRLSIDSFENADLSFIGEMGQLEGLAVYNSNSSFTETVGKLTNLKSLSVIKCTPYRMDLSFLPKLKSLEELFIVNQNIDDLKGISKLKKLEALSLWVCEYNDLSELSKCTSLKELDISFQSTDFDTAWIEGLPIEELMIKDTFVLNGEKITSLKKLKSLVLEYAYGISDETVDKIKKALPDCKIKRLD